jgi:hypothetical protein
MTRFYRSCCPIEQRITDFTYHQNQFRSIQKIMKPFILWNILLLFTFHSYSQSAIPGLWYSNDSSRIYKIYTKEKGYEAILHHSKRANDKTGQLILCDLQYHRRRQIYKGYIRAADDGTTVKVKISIAQNGKALTLKLRRMLFFPVYLRWLKHT